MVAEISVIRLTDTWRAASSLSSTFSVGNMHFPTQFDHLNKNQKRNRITHILHTKILSGPALHLHLPSIVWWSSPALIYWVYCESITQYQICESRNPELQNKTQWVQKIACCSVTIPISDKSLTIRVQIKYSL